MWGWVRAMAGRGFFICIEGLDCCGKTTQSLRLVETLRGLGFDAVYTAEPSGGEVGSLIRRCILDRRRRVPVVVEAVLFAADRLDHVESAIKPMLSEGKIVVSDRYLYSSLAYQGAAGLDIGWLLKINRFAPKPDLAIFIDVPPERLVVRFGRRRSVMEYLEVQREVYKVYRMLVDDGRLIPVDGDRPIDEVSRDIVGLVLDRLRVRGMAPSHG